MLSAESLTQNINGSLIDRELNLFNHFNSRNLYLFFQLTTTALTDATIVEDLLEELNSDPVSETPKPDSRTGFFLGSGKTVENVLAECYDDSLFSKTSLRKKKSSQPDIRPPSPKRFLQLNVDFDETTLSCSPPRNAKRVLQESPAKSPPIKKETLEEARQNIST